MVLARSFKTLTRYLVSATLTLEREPACNASQAPTLCPARTTLTEGPKVDCTASNILRAL